MEKMDNEPLQTLNNKEGDHLSIEPPGKTAVFVTLS
jgi:hypothetical protein